MYIIGYNLKQYSHNTLFIDGGIVEFESLLLRHFAGQGPVRNCEPVLFWLTRVLLAGRGSVPITAKDPIGLLAQLASHLPGSTNKTLLSRPRLPS